MSYIEDVQDLNQGWFKNWVFIYNPLNSIGEKLLVMKPWI
jgi:hypothetical protein